MILVTGATGLVGGHLLWFLLQENNKVVAIKRKNSNLKTLKTIFSFYTPEVDFFLNKIEWRTADVLDQASLLNAMCDITQVYHCAGVVSFGDNSGNVLMDTNVIGTKNIVETSLEKKIEKFCFVSSIAACGSNNNGEMISEKDVWIDSPMKSPYARSKYYAEQEVWLGIKKGLNAVIVNPGVILGISGTNSGSSQLFYQVKKGLIFYTNGGSAYVDVQDVAKCMIGLMKSDIKNERFIISSENCSNKEILSWMADGFHKRRPFILVGKNLMIFLGGMMEILGQNFNFKPVIDRATARTAVGRKYYANEKIKNALDIEFASIEQSIINICKYMSVNQ